MVHRLVFQVYVYAIAFEVAFIIFVVLSPTLDSLIALVASSLLFVWIVVIKNHLVGRYHQQLVSLLLLCLVVLDLLSLALHMLPLAVLVVHLLLVLGYFLLIRFLLLALLPHLVFLQPHLLHFIVLPPSAFFLNLSLSLFLDLEFFHLNFLNLAFYFLLSILGDHSLLPFFLL